MHKALTAEESAVINTLMPDLAPRVVEYIDLTPKPFVVQIPLYEYFERIKRYKADRWQKDFCNRLQKALENRHLERDWTIYHAEAQLGKTSILSQVFPSYIFGQDPLFRYSLMMYNKTRSELQSEVVIMILQSDIHKDIFPDRDGWLESDTVSKSAWSTKARRELNDGQHSFNPVGLQSGLTGSGFDWLTIDDPYANEQDAFSATINQNMRNKYDYTVMSRVSPYSCISGMFHRYAPDDFAGYLLDTGDFDYIRYASQFDGDFIHDETGRVFPDPIGRKIGEYISPERRPPSYYDKAKKNSRVWLSMFQGRPSAEQGDFFNIGKIETISSDLTADRRAECSVLVRSWDLAATEAGGDYSVGFLLGMRPDGKVTVFDVVREQVETAGRDELQKKTAQRDGPDVIITVPSDVGAGGKSTVFHIQQLLQGYEVVARSVSGKKEDRARNFAGAVNSGDVEFVDDSHLPENKQWIKPAKKEMRDFPLSDNDDIVDAGGDAYNEAYERMAKGLVIPHYKAQRNVISRSAFLSAFPNPKTEEAGIFKMPKAFTVYVGVKITPEATRPNSAVIVARASQNSDLDETLFVVSEYKAYNNNFYELFDWIVAEINYKCVDITHKNVAIYLHPDSESYIPTLRQKLNHSLRLFEFDNIAGLTETSWYLMPREQTNPFNSMEKSTGLYIVVPDEEVSAAFTHAGMYALRQELTTWGFNDKGEPSGVGQVADCLRMLNYAFRTRARSLTLDERVVRELEAVKPKAALKEIKETAPDQRIVEAEVTSRAFTEQQIRDRLKERNKPPVPDWTNIG
jgi:predicted phage terminase large subunit-like protein